MAQNSDEWKNLKSQYLASLTSQSQIRGTKTTFFHLDAFLNENNLIFKDLSSHNRDSFKAYLKNKVPSSNSRKTYWSFFSQFYSWLETNLKLEPVFRPQEPQPQTPVPALTEKGEDESYIVPLAETELTDQLQEWEQEGIFKVEWCNYGSIIKEGERLYKIHCSSPKETQKRWLPKDRLLTPIVCRNCGLRKEGAREQRQRRFNDSLESKTTSKEPQPLKPTLLPKITPEEHFSKLLSQKEPLTYAQRLIAKGLMSLQEKQRFKEAEILRKKEELSLKEKKRYAITHQLYETNCHSCSHLLGYYSDSEKKFGTVECNSEVCDKR